MKILHITSSKGMYGAESVLLSLLAKMKEQGEHEVSLVCLRTKDKDEPDVYFEAQKLGIAAEVCFCAKKRDKNVTAKIRDLIDEKKIDVLHTHGTRSNHYGLQVAGKNGVPVVATLHGFRGGNLKERFSDYFNKRHLKSMDHAICVSEKTKQQVLDAGLAQEKVSCIPDGVDTGRFNEENTSAALRGELGLQGPIVIGCLGRLSKEAGHKYLLEAFKDIHETYDEARLLIVGEGALKKELQEKAKKMKIEEAVVFAGEREQMPEVYMCMDIFVLPSLNVSAPVTLLEAMSMRLAVVATDIGEAPKILEDDAGMIIKKGRPRELAEAISPLVEKKKLRQEYGQRARRRVEECYSVAGTVTRYNDVYQEVLRGRMDEGRGTK